MTIAKKVHMYFTCPCWWTDIKKYIIMKRLDFDFIVKNLIYQMIIKSWDCLEHVEWMAITFTMFVY